MRIVVFFLIYSISVSTVAQSWSWVKATGFGSQDRSTDIVVDNWGNVYTVGYFSSSLNLQGSPLISNGGTDAFITKYASGGALIWAKRFGGNGNDEAWGVGTDSLGNVYVSGSFQDTVQFGLIEIVSKGFDDVFCLKLDSAGNQLRAYATGSIYPDRYASITTNQKGEVFMTGMFADNQGPPWVYETIDFYPYQLMSFGSADIFLVKFDTNGDVSWAKNAGGLSMDLAWKPVLDPDGQILVSGVFLGPTTASFDQFSISHDGFGDAFVVKYSGSGDVQWVNSGTGNSDDFGIASVVDSKGNVYLLGSFTSNTISFGTTVLPGNGQAQVFLAKYDVTGSLLWAKQYGDIGWDDPMDITIDGNDNLYMTGLYIQSTSFGNYNLIGQAQDLFVVKCDTNGNVLWATSAGGMGSDVGTCITYSQVDNSLYVTGRCSGDATFDSHSANSTGANFFVAKLSDVSSLPQVPASENDVVVYPNPAAEVVNVILHRPFSQISVYDQTGRVLLHQLLKSDQHVSISTASLSPGVYWMRIEGKETSVHKKLLITK